MRPQAPEPSPAFTPTITAWPASPVPAQAAAPFDGRRGAVLRGGAGKIAPGRGTPTPGPAPPGGPPVRGPADPTSRPRGFRWPLALALAVLLIAGGSTAALVLFRHFHGHPSSPGRSAAGFSATGQTTASTAPPPPPTQEGAADNLSALLSQSVADRNAIVSAVSDVNQCGPNLNQDAQTFESAAISRQNLLARLADLSGQSALPGQMLQALTGAWQASAQADQDFAQWAQTEVSHGCTQNDHADPNYQAATGPDNQATTDKEAFAALWNPLAKEYELTTYQWDQL